MGLRFKFVKDPEYVVPKIDDLDIELVDFTLPVIIPDTSGISVIGEENNAVSGDASSFGSQWVDFTLSIDLKREEKVVEVVGKALKSIDKVVNIFVVILKIIRILSSDLKNISMILKILLGVIVKQLKAIIEGLTSMGVYACIINPDFDTKGKKYAMPINGGFLEFQQRVTASLLNSSDPGAPKFGTPDKVGGVVIASIAGINDPEILANLIHNFKIIGQFFNFKGFDVKAPSRVNAVPGFYMRDKVLTLGVKITWTHTEEYASGFVVTRNIGDDKGVYLKTKDLNVIEVFDNRDFNGDKPVEVKSIKAKSKYSYVDFEVTDGTTYCYKVYTFLGRSSDKFFEDNPSLLDLKSSVASSVMFATPIAKIPLTELRNYIEDKRGLIVNPVDLSGDWKSISMRTFLGPAIDRLFDKIDNIADTLTGAVSLGSDALGNYIKFMEKKIKKILKILDTIEDIIKIVASFSFKGTMAVLKLSPEEGGMEGLAKRFSDACGTPSTPVDGGTKTGNPFYGSSEKGIMFGVILVFGFPSTDGEYFKRYFKPIGDVGESGEKKIKQSIKSIETVLGMLGLS